MIWRYTNRRRAKDAVMAFTELSGDGDIEVMVADDDLIFIKATTTDTSIFHFGEVIPDNLNEKILAMAKEIYRGRGTRKFRV